MSSIKRVPLPSKGIRRGKKATITSTKVSLIGASEESSISKTSRNPQGLVSKTGSSPFIWKIIPEELKPKKINITAGMRGTSKDTAELLNEGRT